MAYFYFFFSITWGQVLVSDNNTFPTKGKVGIGIDRPSYSLHIQKTRFAMPGQEVLDGDVWIDGGILRIGRVWDFEVDGRNRSKILSDGSLKIQTNNYPFMMLAEDRQNGTIFTLGIAIAYQNYSHIAQKMRFDFKIKYVCEFLHLC